MATLAVVGGGWAGLAAAVEGVRRGFSVTLFEMAPQLGGRARSVTSGGHELDNGQHILIGAYTETLRLMRTVGVDPEALLLRTPLALVGPDGHGLTLPRGGPVTAFVRGVLAQRGWRLRDRLALLATAARWRRLGFACAPALTVAELAAGLPTAVRAELVEPLCVAALNTPAESASAVVFLRVLRDALFASPGSADLLLPRVGLSALLPAPAMQWLASAGVTLRLGRRVRHVERGGAGWQVDGDTFDGVVLATSAVEAARLAEPIAPDWAARAAALHYEPIVTVYLRSPRAVLGAPMVALAADDTAPAQFVFDHGQLRGDAGLLAFVISGARRWVDLGQEATVAATRAQAEHALARHLTEPLTTVAHLTEKRATFACTPGLARPPAGIAPRLAAAGDHVEGPYPATLEGAVRSGVAAVALAV
jgi:squalene-associated FAD-dependent desaturase